MFTLNQLITDFTTNVASLTLGKFGFSDYILLLLLITMIIFLAITKIGKLYKTKLYLVAMISILGYLSVKELATGYYDNADENFLIMIGKFLGLLFLVYLLSIISLLFKIGAAPFHLWLPDAYAGAPFYVLLFLLTITKIGLFYLLFTLNNIFEQNLIILLALLLSVIIGYIQAFAQTKIKKFIAYTVIYNNTFFLSILGSIKANENLLIMQEEGKREHLLVEYPKKVFVALFLILLALFAILLNHKPDRQDYYIHLQKTWLDMLNASDAELSAKLSALAKRPDARLSAESQYLQQIGLRNLQDTSRKLRYILNQFPNKKYLLNIRLIRKLVKSFQFLVLRCKNLVDNKTRFVKSSTNPDKLFKMLGEYLKLSTYFNYITHKTPLELIEVSHILLVLPDYLIEYWYTNVGYLNRFSVGSTIGCFKNFDYKVIWLFKTSLLSTLYYAPQYQPKNNKKLRGLFLYHTHQMRTLDCFNVFDPDDPEMQHRLRKWPHCVLFYFLSFDGLPKNNFSGFERLLDLDYHNFIQQNIIRFQMTRELFKDASFAFDQDLDNQEDYWRWISKYKDCNQESIDEDCYGSEKIANVPLKNLLVTEPYYAFEFNPESDIDMED